MERLQCWIGEPGIGLTGQVRIEQTHQIVVEFFHPFNQQEALIILYKILFSPFTTLLIPDLRLLLVYLGRDFKGITPNSHNVLKSSLNWFDKTYKNLFLLILRVKFIFKFFLQSTKCGYILKIIDISVEVKVNGLKHF